MPTARPFAYNTESVISGTTQVGSLSIGTPTSGFTNSPQYWNGPNEDLGYVIAHPVSGNTQVTPIFGVNASIGFNRTLGFNDNTFINLSESVSRKYSTPQTFSSATEASYWLTTNGFWNSYITTVTGFEYNLVVLPYQIPTTGNTIFPTFSSPSLMSGTTNPNTFTINGVYWNSIDNLGIDRTSYYNGMTGVSVTASFSQNGNTSIYSGSTTAFVYDGPPGQKGFNYDPNSRPNQLVLIQSATTNFVTGQTVDISFVVN